jgi:prephenate dehydrogenase
MGGSMALAMKKCAFATKILGYDSSPENAKIALELGIVDEIISFEETTRADILILAIPVEASVEILSSITLANPNITIIDLGSTKQKVSEDCPLTIRANLVAAHPMSGTEYSGPSAALADLYEGKTVVLCDLQKSGVNQIKLTKEIFNKLNMKIVEMDSAVHDKHAGFISHLPHLMSFSIANTVLNQEDTQSILTLAAGGFKDMSRLAKSSPVMWREIFIQNRQNMLQCLSAFKSELTKFESALESSSPDELTALMENANRLYKIFK